eukprot:CAMPEP_0182466846 /NCGR_PEP_ID=MMETSP1319-20130603/12749_1 /TAXON_ID=172717 /ORGANISM="Bolidomonas pacifica, Strain RCC208" /LENGTH=55 /DNA_ID=CAMNT_0024666885 /DNA_START=33 /DNA_END=200 /DNA_ORIENTATION=-
MAFMVPLSSCTTGTPKASAASMIDAADLSFAADLVEAAEERDWTKRETQGRLLSS